MKLFIVMYHYTRDFRYTRYRGIKGMDISKLRSQFNFFKSVFNVVTMEQVIEATKGVTLPDNALLLTFDDGYIDNYTYAFPLLEEFGFQGSFFIPGKTFIMHQLLDVNKIHYILSVSDIQNLVEDLRNRLNYYRGKEYDYPSNDELWNEYAVPNRFDEKGVVFVKRVLQTAIPEVPRKKIICDLFDERFDVSEEQLAHELYMTEDQIRTMKRHKMFIGLHGFDHFWLGNLPEKEMKEDIDKSIESLNEFIDPNAWVMNYPYGNYNQGVLEYIKSKGALVGLTTEVRVAEIGVDNMLTLPRFDCNDFPPKSKNYLL